MNPRRGNSSLPRPGRSAYGVATAAVLLLIPMVVLLGGSRLQEFLNFGAGVLSLVCLTCSVIWGLVAQGRMILDTRRRIISQGVHRVTAVASIAFLLVHIGVPRSSAAYVRSSSSTAARTNRPAARTP